MAPGAILLVLGAAQGLPQDRSVRAGLQGTAGSLDYRGLGSWARIVTKLEGLDGQASARPSVSAYRSETSSGTIRSLSVRLGYASQYWDVGLTLGASPAVMGYGNGFFGLEATRTLPLAPGRQPTADRWAELGGGLMHTSHFQRFSGAFVNRRGVARTVSGTIEIGQNELYLLGSLTAQEATLGARLARSFYNRDVDQVAAFAARRVALPGLSALVQGFPSSSLQLWAGYDGWQRLKPFLSFTHTAFLLGAPASDALVLGAGFPVGQLDLTPSYELYDPGGSQHLRHYYSFEVAYRFL